MWAKLIATLTGQTVEAVVNYKAQKRQLKADIEMERLRGKAAWEKAKSVRAENSEGRDADWESQSIANSGWKDEWVLIIMSIPMITSFIPWTQPATAAGFEALASTPLWYRTTVMTIYLAIFGLRLWRRDMNKTGIPKGLFDDPAGSLGQ
jgi:hypothetical protein